MIGCLALKQIVITRKAMSAVRTIGKTEPDR